MKAPPTAAADARGLTSRGGVNPVDRRPLAVGEEHNAVAHVFGDMTAPVLDHLGAAFLIGANHPAHVFGIEFGRQRGRTHEVAEQHCQLPALGFARNRRHRSSLSGVGPAIGGPGGQGRYRLEQPLAVAEVEPKLLQIGIGQIAQDVARDAVLGERLA